MVRTMYALDDRMVDARRRQSVYDVNAADNEHTVLGLNFARDLADESPFARCNLARLQRAPEGAG